ELSSDPSAPTPVPSGGEPVLELALTPDSYEQFPELQGAPPNQMAVTVTEEPRFLWYASAGVFTDDTTGRAQPRTTLKLDDNHAPPPGTPIDLWVVVHDDRGGTAFTHRYLVAQ